MAKATNTTTATPVKTHPELHTLIDSLDTCISVAYGLETALAGLSESDDARSLEGTRSIAMLHIAGLRKLRGALELVYEAGEEADAS